MIYICFLSICKETGQGGGRPLDFKKDKVRRTLTEAGRRELRPYSQMYEDYYGNYYLNTGKGKRK